MLRIYSKWGLSFHLFAGCSWARCWEHRGVFCYLVASAFSWEGSQESWRQVVARLLFIILLSPGQPCHSPSTTSFKDSGDGQSRTSLPLSHCQRRRRLEPALSVQRRKLSELIFNSLISNKSMSLVFCLSCSNKRCPLPCRMWYGRVLEKPRLVFGVACSELSPADISPPEWLCPCSSSWL